MRICPRCQQTYTDTTLNFCLNDGELLTETENQPPPTVFMDAPRVTNPNWQTNQPFEIPQNQQLSPNQQFNPPAIRQQQDQTLPIISMILGILSLGIFCCWIAGLPLSIGALVAGYLGMNNANNNPMQYGGKGLAIGGMVIGAIGLIMSIIFMIIGLIGKAF